MELRRANPRTGGQFEAPVDDFDEGGQWKQWQGLVAGTSRLAVQRRIDRCVVVTRAQPGIERNLDVLRSVREESEGHVGIGAWVVAPGRLAEGDEVRPLGS